MNCQMRSLIPNICSFSEIASKFLGMPIDNIQCLKFSDSFLSFLVFFKPVDAPHAALLEITSLVVFYILLISISLYFIAQLIITYTPIHIHPCVHTTHTHAHSRAPAPTHAHTHILPSVWWGVWTAPTDCASLPLCSGVPVVPSPIAVNATIWCATWTS